MTYETFRDLGLAFALALVLIYFLLVMEFGNFVVPMIIMAPIPSPEPGSSARASSQDTSDSESDSDGGDHNVLMMQSRL